MGEKIEKCHNSQYYIIIRKSPYTPLHIYTNPRSYPEGAAAEWKGRGSLFFTICVPASRTPPVPCAAFLRAFLRVLPFRPEQNPHEAVRIFQHDVAHKVEADMPVRVGEARLRQPLLQPFSAFLRGPNGVRLCGKQQDRPVDLFHRYDGAFVHRLARIQGEKGILSCPDDVLFQLEAPFFIGRIVQLCPAGFCITRRASRGRLAGSFFRPMRVAARSKRSQSTRQTCPMRI